MKDVVLGQPGFNEHTPYVFGKTGLATMPIGTVDLSQTYHHIAHGICLHEGTKDHVIALQNVKDEVEAVVARYAASGRRV
ncbi:hypothetical protein T492DRAFT_862514 [Pavlovales sp. CCMP2436]|nr:hypothetical protein T492DRAFT_862514 [Pavlovales sp. CCMP2436]